jgi:uroporphyrinogen decarboxylase
MSLFDYVTGRDRRLAVPLMGSVGARLTAQALEVCLKDPEPHLQELAALADRFSPDVLFPIMDLTLEAEALGLPIAFPDDGAPSVAEHPISTLDHLARLRPPNPMKAGRLPLFIEVAEGMRKIAPALTGAFVIGPFTLAAELAGAEEFAIRTITDVDFVEQMLAFSLEAITGYAHELAARVDVVAILEPSAVMLSPSLFSRLVNPVMNRLNGAIRDAGAFPVLHICGDTAPLLTEMADSGADGFSLDSLVDLRAAASKVRPNQVLLGNIAPVAVMLEMDVGNVREACGRLLMDMVDIPNFMIASGCDLPADTPPENIAALIASVIPG